jgi:flagellar protein FliS
MAYSNGLSAYRETRVRTAGQGKLIIMLYDEAVRQLDRAIDLMERNITEKKDPGRIEPIGRAVSKTKDIITELIVSLDFDQGGQIAKNLFALYTWFNKELLEAHLSQNLSRVSAVRTQLNELRQAWSNVAFSAAEGGRPVEGVNIAG